VQERHLRRSAICLSLFFGGGSNLGRGDAGGPAGAEDAVEGSISAPAR